MLYTIHTFSNGEIAMNIMDTVATVAKLAKAGLTLELQEKIVELREQIISLVEVNTLLRSEKLDLEEKLKLATSGDRCPKCKEAEWKLTETKPHPNYLARDLGLKTRVFACTACGYSEDIVDQLGA